MKTMNHLLLAMTTLCCAAAQAQQIAVDHYDINDAVLSGHGGDWSHTYDGTITPGVGFVNNTYAGTSAAYQFGSGTLNDGVIAASLAGTQLFVTTATDGTVLNPTIFLTLDFSNGAGPWLVDHIDIFGGDISANFIPGAISNVTVGLIGPGVVPVPKSFATTAFGPGLNAAGGFTNDRISMAGSGLELAPSFALVLSDFQGTVGNWFSITEIKVYGVQAAAAVPEPHTYALMLAGLAGLAIMRRRMLPSR